MKKLEKVLSGVVIGIIILFAVLFITLFIMVSLREDNTEKAKKEFSKYYNGKNEVGLIFSTYKVYFEDCSIDFNQFEEDFLFNTILLFNCKIFYATFNNGKIEFYSCDTHGNEKK